MTKEWEQIADYTYRLKVEGGYLYRYIKMYFESVAVSMVFVPDVTKKET